MYGGDNSSGGHYTNRLHKHPRLSRMQGLPEKINGQAAILQRGKQPRPLEDGNWVCDDPSCSNVNYPRRTECNKCGKHRGPLGDAVVKAYIETIKIARELNPAPPGLFNAHLISGAADCGSTLVRGMLPHLSSTDVPAQQGGISISSGGGGGGSSHISSVGEIELWMNTDFEGPLFPSFASHYVTGDGGMSGRRSTLSAATEGKRLAEQLVASFAASTDPVADAGECLASAALWLQTMKSRLQTGDSVGLATSSISGLGSGSSGRGSLGSLRTPLNGVNMLSQPHVGVATNVGMTSGSGGLGSLAINSGPGISRSNLLGSSVGGHGNTPGAMGSLLGSHGKMGCPGVCFEDFKDRPSDFLREFGDPAAVTATAMGGGQRPEPGVNGNWECEDCKNVNFPRRINCFQCHKRRGLKGDDIVRNYVRSLIEDPGSIHN
ncbi:hypothetical protein BDL97_04G047300 [Sphagnum fallax]|nr:hypothetical protein BDL97_04G047300 [Sphagnum fallax]